MDTGNRPLTVPDRPRSCGALLLALGRPLLLLVCLSALTVPGCGGCSQDEMTQAEREAKEKKRLEELAKEREKRKPPFENARAVVLPSEPDTLIGGVKPGHWVSTIQRMRANHFDFVGELETGVVDQQDRPIYLERTPFRLTTTRPAVLPKGQYKYLEAALFVPANSKQTRVASTLHGRRGGAIVDRYNDTFNPMPSYQYYFVILASEPDRYGYVKVLDSINAPWDDESLIRSSPHYRVVMPRLEKPLQLSSHSLTWTNTAYLLWDEVDPGLFSPEQKTAMLDWLHWGGQIIISGPDSLDALRGSFLDPFLPATAGDARRYNNEDLREINATWTLRGKKNRPGVPLAATVPWSGITLEKHPEAEEVPSTGGLLVERRVGRGRIVVSAVQLNQRDLINWHGFDGFFNACLLRRPSRRFREAYVNEISVKWAAADLRSRRLDARLTSGLRYFSRDLGTDTNYEVRIRQDYNQFGLATEPEELVEPHLRGGVGAWNDFSPMANRARAALLEAAGIEIPKSRFVVLVLAAYLIVLVPLNWLFFQAMGRVEWAWAAAPVIAILCALSVVRLAQLDIGFARSRTEIAVLELQKDYPRAHLTRYSALYTSLSTTYDLRFDDLSSLAQPFPTNYNFRLIPGQSRPTVTYRRQEDVRLSGLAISSNNTDMVHSEQMVELAGAIVLGKSSLGRSQVVNRTRLDLTDVGLVRKRTAEGGATRVDVCWIGDLPAGQSAPVGYGLYQGVEALADERNKAAGQARGARLSLGRLFELADDPKYSDFKPGEVRLVGRTTSPISGLQIRPEASQLQVETLIVVHLDYGKLPAPQPDVNTRETFGSIKVDGEEDIEEIDFGTIE